MKKLFWKFHNTKFEFLEDLSVTQSAWSGHFYFVYDLIGNFKPSTIVELGTHKGSSLFSMAQAIKDFKLNTKLHGIDSWEGDVHAGYYGDDIYKKVLYIKEKFYKKVNLITHKIYFDEAVEKFENNSIDLLHIDGLHTYDAVQHDFKTWLPKVNHEGGIILLHDICVKRKGFGVYKLWEELKKEYNTIQFNHYHGLGVIIFDENLYNLLSNKGILRKAKFKYYTKSLFALFQYPFNRLSNLLK